MGTCHGEWVMIDEVLEIEFVRRLIEQSPKEALMMWVPEKVEVLSLMTRLQLKFCCSWKAHVDAGTMLYGQCEGSCNLRFGSSR